MNESDPILHLILNPARLAAAQSVMSPEDQVILGGDALSGAIDALPVQRVSALTTDARELGLPPMPGLDWIEDTEWVRRVAQAERVVQW